MIRVDGRLLAWGTFFLCLGLVPLASRSNLVPADLRWLDLWPLLLVGWGISLLFRATPAGAVGRLLVAATFGAILGAILGGSHATGFDIGRLGLACSGPEGGAFPARSGTFGPRASVALELTCGELAVDGRSGRDWSVSGTTPDGRPPAIEAGPERLLVRSIGEGRDPFGLLGGTERWQVALPTEGILDLAVTLNAGQATVRPGAARLEAMTLTVNAGSATLDLEAATLGSLSATVTAGSLVVHLPTSSLTGSLTVNAGSIVICTPPDVGLRLTTNDNPTGSFDYPGLIQTGNVWTNAAYATAPIRIELSTAANAGSIALDGVEACR